MAVPRFMAEAARNADPKKLDQQIMNGGQSQRYMDEGEHDVVCVGIDYNQYEDNKVTLKYANAEGAEYRDMIFCTATDRKSGAVDYSWKFKGTLGMLLHSTEAYNALLAELMADNPAVFDLLVGLKGKIVLKRGDGYGAAEATANNTYIVRVIGEPKDPSVVAFEGATIEEARNLAKEAGYQPAFVNTQKYVALAAEVEANLRAFTSGLTAQKKPQANSPFKSSGAGVVDIPF